MESTPLWCPPVLVGFRKRKGWGPCLEGRRRRIAHGRSRFTPKQNQEFFGRVSPLSVGEAFVFVPCGCEKSFSARRWNVSGKAGAHGLNMEPTAGYERSHKPRHM